MILYEDLWMTHLNNTQHTLFITHGSSITLKLLSRKLNPEDEQWFVLYDGNHYQLQKLNKAGESAHLPMTFLSYKDLVGHVLNSPDAIIRCVAIDANFGTIAGENFSGIAHNIVRLTQTKEALFFTETPACVDDTKQYLQGRLMLKPPFTLKRAQVSLRSELRSSGIDFVDLKHDCRCRLSHHFSHFSRRVESMYERGCHTLFSRPRTNPHKVYADLASESGSMKTNTTSATTKVPRSRSLST